MSKFNKVSPQRKRIIVEKSKSLMRALSLLGIKSTPEECVRLVLKKMNIEILGSWQ